MRARVALLHVNGRCLGAGNHADARIAGATCGQYDAGQQRRHHRQLHTLLGLDTPREVALRQVRQFVGQYRGIFALGLGVEEQPTVDPYNATRGGKGVQLAAVDQDEFQAPVLQLAGFGQLVHAGFDIVLELWVIELIDLAAQQAEPGTAQLVLLLRRDDRRTVVTQ